MSDEFTQIHKLWTTFFSRLEGRGLAFHNVVTKEGRRYILEDLCFISEEAAMLEKEWHCIVNLLQRARALRPTSKTGSFVSLSEASTCGTAKLSWPRQRQHLDTTCASAISEVNSVISTVEAYNESISAALTSLEHCEYRVRLYSRFLLDQIKTNQTMSAQQFKSAQGKIERKVTEFFTLCACKRDEVSKKRKTLCTIVVPWLLCALRALHALAVTLRIHQESRNAPDQFVFETVLRTLGDVDHVDKKLCAIEVPEMGWLRDYDRFVASSVPMQTVFEGSSLSMPAVTALAREFVPLDLCESPNDLSQHLPPLIDSEEELSSVSGGPSARKLVKAQHAAWAAALAICAQSAATADRCLHVRDVTKLPSSGEGLPYKYQRVVVHAGGLLTTTPWDGLQGGTLHFQCEEFNVAAGGVVDLSGLGFRGGAQLCPDDMKVAQQGECGEGIGAFSLKAHYGGGGGGTADPKYGTWGGGGGGGATVGDEGKPARCGGEGGAQVASPQMGCGGGGGHPLTPCLPSDSEEETFSDSTGDSDNDCVPGGCGGGMLIVEAAVVARVDGKILCNGMDGGNAMCVGASGGGGGAGGVVRIMSPCIVTADSVVEVKGGRGGSAPPLPGKHPQWQPCGGNGASGTVCITETDPWQRVQSLVMPAEDSPALNSTCRSAKERDPQSPPRLPDPAA